MNHLRVRCAPGPEFQIQGSLAVLRKMLQMLVFHFPLLLAVQEREPWLIRCFVLPPVQQGWALKLAQLQFEGLAKMEDHFHFQSLVDLTRAVAVGFVGQDFGLELGSWARLWAMVTGYRFDVCWCWWL